MICSNCGNALREGQKFCTVCGTPVAMTPKASEPETTLLQGMAPTPAAQSEPVYTDLGQPAPQPENPDPLNPVQEEPDTSGETVVLSGLAYPGPMPSGQPNETGRLQGQQQSPGQVPPAPGPQGMPFPGPGPEDPKKARKAEKEAQKAAKEAQKAAKEAQKAGISAGTASGSAPKNKKKWLLPVIIAGSGTLLLLGALAALYFFVFHRTVKIDINEYLNVSFKGYNNYGEAEWELDRDRFREDFADKLKFKSRGEYPVTADDAVLSSVYPSLSACYDLTNDDEITVSWEVNEMISDVVNVEITAEEKKITVSGLKDPEEVNPFENFKCSFAGYDGRGYVETASYGSDEEWLAFIPLKSDYRDLENLSNGDEVTFSCNMEDSDRGFLIREYGLVPSVTEYKVTVSGLEEIREVDPFENFKYSFAGYNGRGYVESASYGLDAEWLYEIPLNRDYEELKELSNGDKVTFSFDVTDEIREIMIELYGVNPGVTEYTVEVSGLEDLPTFDPFEGIEVVYGGKDGTGYVDEINVENADPACADIYYEYDYRRDLSNGDEIVISIDEEEYSSDYFAGEQGKIPSVFEKTFEVSGLPEVLKELSEIPQEKIDAFDQAVSDFYENEYMPQFEEYGFRFGGVTPLGMTLMVPDPDADTVSLYENLLYSFYELKISVDGQSEPKTIYVPLYVEDIQLDESGVPNLVFDKDATYFANDQEVVVDNNGTTLTTSGMEQKDGFSEELSPDNSRNIGLKQAGSTFTAE